MTRRRFHLFFLSLFLLTSAVGTWIAVARTLNPGALSSAPKLSGHRETDAVLKPQGFAMRVLPPSRNENVLEKGTPLACVLSPESADQLTEQIELNGIAVEAGLCLSSLQLKTFADVTSMHQAIREAYELEIAALGRSPAGNLRLEIPLYADAGDVLRTAFYRALRDALGDFVSGQILAKVGPQLESRFAGFGVAEQTLELASERTPLKGSLILNRTVVYWNSLTPGDHLLTRRESNFSGSKDFDSRVGSAVQSLSRATSLTSRL